MRRGAAPGNVLVVGHHEDRAALPDQVFEDIDDRFGGGGIEAAGGFIGDQDGRVVGHGAGDGQPLLLAAG